jgi:pimeloyl-ACP methyl ester carboxylesterase
LPGLHPSDTVREVNGKLDRPGGALHFEVIDATPPCVRDAPLIVFHHGIGATADIWAEWLPALGDRFRIARFDTLGFGRSAQPGPGYAWSLDGLVEDALAVARAAGGGPFHFVGESLGGTDLTPDLGRIGVPTLLLAPARSPFVPLPVMEAIHAAIPGSELQVFGDARHGLPCSHGPACGRALRAFLDRRAPSVA